MAEVAGSSVTLKVEGLRELEKALVELANCGAPAILGKALKTPMEKILEDAKALVPTDTGALRDSLALTPVRRANARRASSADSLSEVGIRIQRKKVLARAKYTKEGKRNRIPNPRRYWHLVEFGTSRTAAKPYLRPAFDQNVQPALGSFKATLSSEIKRVVARNSRRRSR